MSGVDSSSSFTGGSGKVTLTGPTKFGTLSFTAQEHTDANERTLIIRGKIGNHIMQRSFFSHDGEKVVFGRLVDNDHNTTMVLSNTEDPKIGSVTVSNDDSVPKTFKIDINKFLKVNNQKESIIDGPVNEYDPVGKRQPLVISPQELYKTFGKDPSYVQFMRGSPATHLAPGVTPETSGLLGWKCWWYCLIPACGLACLLWSPGKSNSVFSGSTEFSR